MFAQSRQYNVRCLYYWSSLSSFPEAATQRRNFFRILCLKKTKTTMIGRFPNTYFLIFLASTLKYFFILFSEEKLNSSSSKNDSLRLQLEGIVKQMLLVWAKEGIALKVVSGEKNGIPASSVGIAHLSHSIKTQFDDVNMRIRKKYIFF